MNRLYPTSLPTSISHLVIRAPLIVAPIIIAILLLGPGGEKMPEAVVTLCFDDGYSSVYEVAFPLLKQYHYPATVFVIPSVLGQKGYLTLNQLRILSNNGWEIGSHTWSHPNLTEISLEEVEKELKKSKEWLLDKGFKVYSFAYPYGAFNEEIIEKVKKYYKVARIGEGTFNDIPLSQEEIYTIKALDVNSPSIKDVDDIKAIIKKAKEEKKWLVLIFHRINEEGFPKISVSDKFLEEILKTLKEENFKGIKVEDIL